MQRTLPYDLLQRGTSCVMMFGMLTDVLNVDPVCVQVFTRVGPDS